MTKKIFNKSFLLALIISSLAGCGLANSIDTTNLSDNVETGITVSSAVADDAASAGIGVTSLSIDETSDNGTAGINEFTCTGNWTGCSSSGVKTRSVDCSNASTGIEYTKNLTVSFYKSDGSVDNTCIGLATAGNYVVRTGTDTLTFPSNGTYTSTSTAANNYSGVSIGGGSQLSKNTDGTYSMAITGMSRSLVNAAGKDVWNHSIHTLSADPLVLNQFRRNGRKISKGTVIVDHNIAKFTASMAFSDVTYTNDCCYPISGTITTTLTGSRTGTVTLTFSSTTCGQVFMSSSKEASATITMKSCVSSVN